MYVWLIVLWVIDFVWLIDGLFDCQYTNVMQHVVQPQPVVSHDGCIPVIKVISTSGLLHGGLLPVVKVVTVGLFVFHTQRNRPFLDKAFYSSWILPTMLFYNHLLLFPTD